VTAAIFFVSLLSFFLTRMYWKKNRHQSLYNMASNGEIVSDISVFFFIGTGTNTFAGRGTFKSK
jgi:hypothetical protein